MKSEIKIVALSDTHTFHRSVKVPDGDVLVFAGDLMGSGYKHQEVKDFADWFSNQPHRVKILVSGNHDRMFENNLEYCLSKFNNIIYLCNSGCEVDGWKFWGSPYQPEFCNWAFNVQRGERIKKHWDLIPEDTDILITHGPPYGILDQIVPGSSENLGCEELRKIVDKIRPKINIFGHIHGSYGSLATVGTDWQKKPIYYNVSICNEAYRPVHSPIIIKLYKEL